jgi:biopolymer transport protein TolR
MPRARKNRRRLVADINIVPYIDVMLVLLMVFMITAPLLNQGVKVDLPQASSQKLPSQSKPPLIVTVDKTGHYYLNTGNSKQALNTQALSLAIRQQLLIAQKSQKPREVYVRGDKAASYGEVVKAMAIIQQAGQEKVGLITTPEAG